MHQRLRACAVRGPWLRCAPLALCFVFRPLSPDHVLVVMYVTPGFAGSSPKSPRVDVAHAQSSSTATRANQGRTDGGGSGRKTAQRDDIAREGGGGQRGRRALPLSGQERLCCRSGQPEAEPWSWLVWSVAGTARWQGPSPPHGPTPPLPRAVPPLLLACLPASASASVAVAAAGLDQDWDWEPRTRGPGRRGTRTHSP
jgi:hypothetical protein